MWNKIYIIFYKDYSYPCQVVNFKSSTESTKIYFAHLGKDYDTSKVSNFGYSVREPKESAIYYNPTESVNSADEDILDTRDSEEKQFQQTEIVKYDVQKIEVEQLFHTPNVNETLVDISDCEVFVQNVEYIQSSQSVSCQSLVPNQVKDVLPNVDSDHHFDGLNISDDGDTLSNIFDGKSDITSYACMHM